MKALASLLSTTLLCAVSVQAAMIGSGSTPAAEAATPPASWHATSLGEAVAYMALFAVIGIVIAIVGYKIFDKATPGDLTREIIENKNVAAAIVAASVILGVCIIVAAAMLG